MAIVGAADAQTYDRGRNMAVTQRERPDYQALGINAGGFRLYPRLQTQTTYTSNLFARETDVESDTFFSVVPSVNAVSNWGRHQLGATATLRLRRYLDHSAENQDGWAFHTFGRLDVHGQDTITGSLDAQKTFEERSSSQSPDSAAKPLPINIYAANVRGVHDFNRVRLSSGLLVRKYDYHNVPSVSGGIVDVSGRDRTLYTGDVKGEYAITPDSAVFVTTSYTKTEYDITSPSDHGSKQVQVLGGANFDLTALGRGEIGLGYVQRKYNDPAVGRTRGFAATANVEYFPTRTTTVTLNLRRSVEDAIDFDGGGFFLTTGTLTVDHELRRNILVNASAGVENQKYESLDRENRTTRYEVGGTYLVNRGLGLNLSVAQIQRNSSGVNKLHDFDETRAALGVVLQR
ncbi:outer membrane beta-barrel protein [Phenylobacterium sp. LjRoot225]|uniref:outer membrane beta-barrel protein n=1 Tax=Phenylobacterium sp. LjRoot225 TaxID=3342285 RepID=UPI003ED099D4